MHLVLDYVKLQRKNLM